MILLMFRNPKFLSRNDPRFLVNLCTFIDKITQQNNESQQPSTFQKNYYDPT